MRNWFAFDRGGLRGPETRRRIRTMLNNSGIDVMKREGDEEDFVELLIRNRVGDPAGCYDVCANGSHHYEFRAVREAPLGRQLGVGEDGRQFLYQRSQRKICRFWLTEMPEGFEFTEHQRKYG